MKHPTLVEILNRFSGNFVTFALEGQQRQFFGRVMTLTYNTSGRQITTPTLLSFDVIEDIEEFKKDPIQYKFRHLSVHEGQVREIEKVVF